MAEELFPPHNDVLFAKQVINKILSQLEPSDKTDFKNVLGNLFSKPLIVFDTAYNNFITRIGKDANLYENWLCLQHDVYTELGPYRKQLLDSATELTESIITQTPGGDSFIRPQNITIGYQIAFLIRAFGTNLEINNHYPVAIQQEPSDNE